MKRHTTDLVSLVFGLAFVGIAAWWLVSLYFDLRVPHLGWFAAGGLILFGLDREEEPEPAHTPPTAA
jgi:hypothetical protein